MTFIDDNDLDFSFIIFDYSDCQQKHTYDDYDDIDYDDHINYYPNVPADSMNDDEDDDKPE